MARTNFPTSTFASLFMVLLVAFLTFPSSLLNLLLPMTSTPAFAQSSSPKTTTYLSIVPSASTKGSQAYALSPVTIAQGGTVLWTNNDSSVHTVTSSNNPDNAGIFDSGPIGPRSTFQHTFQAPGSVSYYCTLHPTMVGIVNIVSSIQKLSLSASSFAPHEVPSGGSSSTLSASFTINNPNPFSVQVGLGMSTRATGTNAEIPDSDLSHELVLFSAPGTNTYNRQFTLDNSQSSGKYDVAMAIWDGKPGFSNRIDFPGWQVGALTIRQPSTITVKTDKLAYNAGDSVLVSGLINGVVAGQSVSITIRDPDKAVVAAETAFPDREIGLYLRSITLPNTDSTVSGTYTVDVAYNGATDEVTFIVTKQGPITKITIHTDKSQYTYAEHPLITGSISPVIFGEPVRVDWHSPGGRLRGFNPLQVSQDGSYSFDGAGFGAGDNPGIYRLVANYNGESAEAAPITLIAPLVSIVADKSTYTEGDTMNISGNVAPQVPGQLVEVTVNDPNSNLYKKYSTISPDASGRFSIPVPLSGAIGTYSVMMTYDSSYYPVYSKPLSVVLQNSSPIPRLTIQTDKQVVISNKDLVLVSGQATGITPNQSIMLQFRKPEGSNFFQQPTPIGQLGGSLDANTGTWMVSGLKFEDVGTWTAVAAYGRVEATTTFQVVAEAVSYPPWLPYVVAPIVVIVIILIALNNIPQNPPRQELHKEYSLRIKVKSGFD